MVTKSERKYIYETVGSEIIANRIIEYLNRNKEEVGYEVFKNEDGNLDETKRIFRFMFKENWTKERFLKYLLFFYYSEADDNGKTDDDSDFIGFWVPERSFAGVLEAAENEWDREMYSSDEDEQESNLEMLDEKLNVTSTKLMFLFDLLIVEAGRSCEEVIDYLFENCMKDSVTFDLEDWFHYLKLCEKTGEQNWFPEDLDYSLRKMQESVGEDVRLIWPSMNYTREGTDLVFHFYHVPVDSDGKPVMRWLGIKLEGKEEVFLEKGDGNPFDPSNDMLIVKAKPNTRVREYDSQKNRWEEIYTGPQNIDVDFSLISRKRKELKLSQSDVSEAIGVGIRTYQKWESGNVKGISGFFLLRLMRYLDIKLDQITLDKGK